MFYFHPYLGMISNLTNNFSKGLKPPTSYDISEILRVVRYDQTTLADIMYPSGH